MLSEAFIDWWFAPWAYAGGSSPLPASQTDVLGQRDAYRIWCAAVDVPACIPDRFDAGWQSVAPGDRRLLETAGRLFGGLIAARRHDRALLAQLPPDDRRWCMSIASVQPLAGIVGAGNEDDALDVRGLAELAVRLERDFPGIWPRLRLVLPLPLRERVRALADAGAGETITAEPTARRALRCWQLCEQRARRHTGQQARSD